MVMAYLRYVRALDRRAVAPGRGDVDEGEPPAELPVPVSSATSKSEGLSWTSMIQSLPR
jgi:hypothetical protein